ncbi:hypothetical protein KJ966_13570 [bacterium]|nr:hypothetical protein [bacterium]
MNKQEMKRAVIYPVSTVFFIMVLSIYMYSFSKTLNNDNLHQALAFFFGTTYFLAVALGTPVIYSFACLGGASLKLRILAISITPFAWATKECIKIFESHSLLECLYWYLNPLNIWLIMLMALEAGLADLYCRRLKKNRGENIRVANLSSLLTVFISLSLFIAAYSWGKGENIYVIFLKGYRFLFGSGL